MASFADLERLRRPAVVTVTVQLDGTTQERVNGLRRRIADARAAAATGDSLEAFGVSLKDAPTVTADLEAELVQVREAAKATEASFTFQAIGYAALEDIRMACPPTATQLAEDMQWNPDEFGPRLIAACAADPTLTDDEARRLWRDWSPGLVNTLYRAAWDVCHSAPVVLPLSPTSSAPTPVSVPN